MQCNINRRFRINKQVEIDPDCLAFVCDNPFWLSILSSVYPWNGTMEISTDDTKTWTTWDGTKTSATVSKSATYEGKYTIYMRGIGNTCVSTFHGVSISLAMTAGLKIACYGNIETLQDYQVVKSGGHPAIDPYCYKRMFAGCTSLTTAPTLPAVTLTYGCYDNMFYNCTSLTTPPSLPFTVVDSYCCFNMFSGCTSLNAIPALYATTLAESCYQNMFAGCTKIALSGYMTGSFRIPYRVPYNGGGTNADNALNGMFINTSGDFAGTPVINFRYFSANSIIL